MARACSLGGYLDGSSRSGPFRRDPESGEGLTRKSIVAFFTTEKFANLHQQEAEIG